MEHGLHDATDDPSRLRRLCHRWPDANIGIATGPSRLVVIDVDPRHGGDESWQRLVRRYGPELKRTFTIHTLNLFAVIVGETSKGHKGSSMSRVRELFTRVDPEWADHCLQSGLSSGEGLIHAVRDPSERRDKDGDVLDPGVEDKRLLVVEEEFARALKLATREGNTLSATIRQAWDSGDLRVLTRNNPVNASGAHISILGHVTRGELLKYLADSEYGSGFANRFLWICARRSKSLPDGGGEPEYRPLVQRAHGALAFARRMTEPIVRDQEARALWHEVYEELSAGKDGMFGAVTGRAEAQALRLSVLYAVLDQSPVVRREHLEAALALWRYAEASAACIFGEVSGDSIADRLLERIVASGSQGLARSDLHTVMGRNRPGAWLDAALESLMQAGRISCRRIPSGDVFVPVGA